MLYSVAVFGDIEARQYEYPFSQPSKPQKTLSMQFQRVTSQMVLELLKLLFGAEDPSDIEVYDMPFERFLPQANTMKVLFVSLILHIQVNDGVHRFSTYVF